MIFTVKRNVFTSIWYDYSDSYVVSVSRVRLRFFSSFSTKIIEIYSVSLSHQRCKWISWKFFCW